MDDARQVLAFWTGVFLGGAVVLIAGLALLIALPATLGAGLLAASAAAARH
jgi:hypothetical protein